DRGDAASCIALRSGNNEQKQNQYQGEYLYILSRKYSEEKRFQYQKAARGLLPMIMPSRMNKKYFISFSMALNVILFTSLAYEKMYHTHPKVNGLRDDGKPLIHQISLRQQVASAQREHENGANWLTKYASAQREPPCKCHGCLTGHNCSILLSNSVINLDHGDPTMFESFWINKPWQETTSVILGWQLMSYFADMENICWFLEPELAKEIRSLHSLVGNAVTEGRNIVIGTGSTQLFQAALYALSGPGRSKPTKVVSATPYYSSYPVVTDYLKSEMYRWAGDALKYKQIADDDYIELVTSPNNPDGFRREAVVNGSGPVVYDHAYYWPHYTPITSPADGDVMLFTVSKSTGHAGSRIGWAIVKDAQVAKTMTKYIELNTIGVSKDSQLRASKILHSVRNSYASEIKVEHYTEEEEEESKENRFFHHGSSLMEERWKRLRDVVSVNHRLSLPSFQRQFCNFFGRTSTPQPAFAWLKCEGRDDEAEEEDCEKLLRRHGIISRSGRNFGATQNY
ncbi:hypothetical protein KI387_007321, partial [Taxus chinensis]